MENLEIDGLKIEKHVWEPSFKNETWITSINGKTEFTITLKEGENIEICCDWDYGYGGRGSERMTISSKLLKELLKELNL
jgi:hypothetical protein